MPTNLLTFTAKTLGNSIVALGTATTSNFYNFATLLKNANIFNPTTGEISGVSPGVFYTVFVPTNTAVVAAAAAGLLPKKTNGTPNLDNTSPAWSPTDITLGE